MTSSVSLLPSAFRGVPNSSPSPRDSDGSEVLSGTGGVAGDVVTGGGSSTAQQQQLMPPGASGGDGGGGEGLPSSSSLSFSMREGGGGSSSFMTLPAFDGAGQEGEEELLLEEDDEPRPCSVQQESFWLSSSSSRAMAMVDGQGDVTRRPAPETTTTTTSTCFAPHASSYDNAAGVKTRTSSTSGNDNATTLPVFQTLPVARTRQAPAIPLPRAAQLALSAAQQQGRKAGVAAKGEEEAEEEEAVALCRRGKRNLAPAPPPPPPYGRKRVDWSKGEAAERMQQAVQECHAMGRKGSWRAVARKYGISWAVLYPRLRGKIAVNASLGAKAMLSREMEEQIYHHCLAMADQGHGLDWSDVKQLAAKMAELAGIQRFKATDGWVRQFQHRFPQLKRYKVQVVEDMGDDDDVSSLGSCGGDLLQQQQQQQRRQPPAQKRKPRYRYILYNTSSGRSPPPPLASNYDPPPPHASAMDEDGDDESMAAMLGGGGSSCSSTPMSSRPDSPLLMPSSRQQPLSTYSLPPPASTMAGPPPERRDVYISTTTTSSSSNAVLHSSSFLVLPPPQPTQHDDSNGSSSRPHLTMPPVDGSRSATAAASTSPYPPFLRAAPPMAMAYALAPPPTTDPQASRLLPPRHYPQAPPPLSTTSSSSSSAHEPPPPDHHCYQDGEVLGPHGLPGSMAARDLIGPYSDDGSMKLGDEDEDEDEEDEDVAPPRKVATRYGGRRKAPSPEQPVLDLLMSQGLVSTTTTRPSIAAMKAFLDRFRLRLPKPRTAARREDFIDFLLRLAQAAPPSGWDAMALQRIGERQRAGHDFENALSIWCPSSSNSSTSLPPLSITHGLPCLAVGPPLTSSSSATTPTAMLTPAASPLSSSDALACLSAAAMGRGAMGIPAEQAQHQLMLRGMMGAGISPTGESSNHSSTTIATSSSAGDLVGMQQSFGLPHQQEQQPPPHYCFLRPAYGGDQ